MMTVNIDLPDEQAAALKAKATAHGVSAEEYARQVLEYDLQTERLARRHISEVIRERGEFRPKSWLPCLRHGASQHDHYIYGLPKKEQ